jgi:hypothetical protein
MKDDLMKAKLEGDRVIIELPLSLLVFAQEHREDSIIVTDEKKMGRYVAENILDFGGDTEIGATEFELLIDKLFTDALENGEDWLNGWWEDEEGEE